MELLVMCCFVFSTCVLNLQNVLGELVFGIEINYQNVSVENETCLYNLTQLDFIHNIEKENLTLLDLIYPCELRYYWVEIQDLVKFVRFLLTYADILLVIIGLFLNTLAFLVLNTPALSSCNLSVYLRALAISDNAALLCNCAVGIARSHSREFNGLFLDNTLLCAVNNVMFIVFFYISTWLDVMLTLERLFLVTWPFVHRRCSGSAVKTVLVLAGACFVVTLTRLQLSGFEQDNVYGYEPCRYQVKGWSKSLYLYFAFGLWFPLLLIPAGNILLLIQLWKAARDKISLIATIEVSKETPKTFYGMTRMLLLLSATYVVLLMPIGIIGSLELYWDAVLFREPSSDKHLYIQWMKEKMLLKRIRGICFFIYHFNFVINFFLYCMSGKIFRNEVKTFMLRFLPANRIIPTVPWLKKLSRVGSRNKDKEIVVGLKTSPSTITLTSVIAIDLYEAHVHPIPLW